MSLRDSARRRIVRGSAWAVLALGLAGCVERRYTIRTNPENALVVVNGEEIGPSPASRSFYFYGERDIMISAPGYETLHVIQPINAPIWDNNFTDFFTENLIPYTFRDEREFTFNLKPVVVPSDAELVQRASALRQQALVPPKPHRGGILGFFGF